ncbi:MAG: PorT family protein [Bacteroidales bacterium]|nr:PorT family protein [Bacteroidales bacterium]
MIKFIFQTLLKFTAIVFILIVPFGSFSQNAIFVKGGTNYNFLGIGFEPGYGDRFGYSLGLGGIIKVGNNLVVNPEVGYSRRSLDLYTPVYINETYTNSNVRLGLNYVDVAAHFGYGGFFEPGADDAFDSTTLLVLYAGPQVSFLTSQDNRLITESEKTGIPEVERIQNYIIGMNAGISFGIRNFYFDARYSIPFNSFLELDTYGDALHSMSLTVGYTFMIR